MSLDEKKHIVGKEKTWVEGTILYYEADIKKFIKELNTRLENWKGNLTAQIVKEIEEEVLGEGLIL